nr:PAS domain S-box protein [uncultured Desulfobacter sp.]
MSIRYKIILPLLALTLSTHIIIMATGYYHSQKAILSEAVGDMESMANVQKRRLTALLDTNFEKLRLISRLTQLQRSLKTYNQTRDEDALDRVKKIMSDAIGNIQRMDGLFVVCPDGEMTISANDKRPQNSRMGHPSFLKAMKKPDVHYFIDQHDIASTKIMFAEPLKLNSEFLGVIVMQVEIGILNELLRDYTGFGSSGEMMMALSGSDNEMLFLTPRRFKKSSAHAINGTERARPMVMALQKIETTLDHAFDYRNEPVIAVTRYLDALGIGIVVKMDRAEVLKTATDLGTLMTGLIIGLMLLTTIISFFLSGMITKPIINITRAAVMISRGDYEKRITLCSKDEIGKLGNALNGMTERLIHANRTLEKKVQEQTSTLLQLEISEEKFRHIFNQAAMGIALSEAETGSYLQVNRKYCEIVGYTEEELSEMNCMKVTHPDDRPLELDNLQRLKEGKLENFKMEKRLIRKDGTLVWTNVAVSLIQGMKDHPLLRVAVFEDITQRRDAEAALLDSISLLDATLESTADGILVVDNKGKMATYNKKFVEMWGVPDDILALKDDDKAIGFVLDQLRNPGEFLEKVKALYHQPEKESFDILKLNDGRIFERFSLPQRVEDLIVGRVWSFRDITKQKRNETALREAEERSRLLLESAGEGIFGVDTEGRTTFVNSAALELLGFQKEELIGRNIHALIHHTRSDGSPYSVEKCPMCHAYAEGLTSHVDNELLWNRNGKKLPVEYTASPIRSQEGITGAVVVFRDVTEIIRAREELLRSEANLVLAQQIAHMGSWELDMPTGKLSWSDEVYRIFELDPKSFEATYETFLNVIHPDDRDLVNTSFSDSVRDRSPYSVEHRLVMPDGRTKYVHEQGETFYDMEGSPIKSIGTILDVTERKKVEKEVLEAKKAAEAATRVKSMFLANMSHEIRTPLNAVLGFLDLVLEDPALSDRHRQYLEIAIKSAHQLLDLINDILDVSKLERGKLIIDACPFSICRLMHDIQSELNIKADEKRIYLKLDIHHSVSGNFIGDPLRLRQIVLNLAGNAIKFTIEGGVFMRVMPAEEEGRLHFIIEDTGIGISADRLSQIFEPFTQADTSTTRRYGGTGLGTTIARELVELMGGRIWVESEEGCGSIFHFTIKLPPTDQIQDDDDVFTIPGKLPLPGERRGFRILLAEDIEANVDLAKIRLEQMGHEVTVARNGVEAVEAVAQREFDVILMDIQMPQMGGIEATERIREFETDKEEHVPVIAMTASVMKEEIEKYLGSGIDRVVPKPVNFEKLFRTIEAVVPEGVGETVVGGQPGGPATSMFELPLLAGIDIKEGIQRWQNTAVYLKKLQAFSLDYKNASAQLDRLIDEGDLDGASRMVHSLTGLAGNLSLTEVAGAVSSIDAALKNRRTDRIKDLVSAFSDALHNVINSIRQLGVVNDIADNSKKMIKEIDEVYLKKLFTKMIPAFDQYTPSVIEPLLSELETYLPQEQLASIVNFIERYDYGSAKKETIKLAAELQLFPKEPDLGFEAQWYEKLL